VKKSAKNSIKKNSFTIFFCIFSFLLGSVFSFVIFSVKDAEIKTLTEKEREKYITEKTEKNTPFLEILEIDNAKIKGNLKYGKVKIADKIFFEKGNFEYEIDKLFKKKEKNIYKNLENSQKITEMKKKGFLYIASKSSKTKKAHSINSNYAKTMSPENIYFFKNKTEVEKLGFHL